MQMSIELVMVIAVTVVVASIAIFLVQSQSSDLGEVLGDRKASAQCEYYKSQYESKVCQQGKSEDAVKAEKPDDCDKPCP